jgi:hypothetical protein
MLAPTRSCLPAWLLHLSYIYILLEADSRFCLEEIEAAPISAGKTCRNGQSNGFSTAAQTLSHPLQTAVSVLMYSWSTRAAPSSRRRRAPSSDHWEGVCVQNRKQPSSVDTRHSILESTDWGHAPNAPAVRNLSPIWWSLARSLQARTFNEEDLSLIAGGQSKGTGARPSRRGYG